MIPQLARVSFSDFRAVVLALFYMMRPIIWRDEECVCAPALRHNVHSFDEGLSLSLSLHSFLSLHHELPITRDY